MDGLDILLTAGGLLGLILSAASLFGKQSWREISAIAIGSLGLFLAGVGGLTEVSTLFWFGVVLLAIGIAYEWWKQRPAPHA